MTVNQENNITFIFNKNYTDVSYMFYSCSSLTSINLSNFNTNNVTNMSYMFYCCKSLTSLDISNLNKLKRPHIWIKCLKIAIL